MRKTIVLVLALLFIVPVAAYAAPSEEGGVVGRTVTIPPQEVQNAIKVIAGQVSRENVLAYNTKLQDFGSRWYRAPNNVNMTRWLHDSLDGNGRINASYHNFSVFSPTYGLYNISNVILTIPGLNTSSNRLYYMYAHSDSSNYDNYPQYILDNSPGADDDGSGCAATLEAARVLSRYGFEDTIKFAFVNAEEIGLYGSEFYAQNMSLRGENVQGGIDYDMIGYSAGSGPSQPDLDLWYNPASQWEATYLGTVNTRYDVGLYISYAPTSGSIPSDIDRFYARGYPSVMGIEKQFSPYYHHISDRVENMNITLTYKCTKLAVAALCEMARLLYVDVTPTNLTASTIRPNEGDPVTITATVNNTGNLNATDLEVAFYDNGVQFSSKRMLVAANSSNTTNTVWSAVQGSHVISVELDPKNEIPESNETNNTANITVAVNDKPRAVLSAVPLTILTNESVTFNGSYSTDSIGGVAEYNFTFGDGNGTGWVTTPAVSHIYRADGLYVASLRVRDPESALSNLANVSITVLNRAPVASPRCDPVRTLTFVPVHFLSNASDLDGTVNTDWDLGDGCETTEANPVHAYSKAGTYDIQLDVRDNDGAGSSYDLQVTVDDRPPVCTIDTSNLTGDITTKFTFSANASDPDGSIVGYVWDLGDGTSSFSQPVKHSFARPGKYAIRLTVKDDDGSEARALINITVIDTPPVASGEVYPTETNSFKRVLFVGEKSSDLEGPITFAWYFGDGNTSAEMSPSHAYAKTGEYVPTLTVTDTSGQNSTVVLASVKVLNRRPKADFRPFGNFSENGTVYFDGSNSSDPEGPVMYGWDFGDGSVGEGALAEHVFPKAGTYNITLKVMDEDGDVCTLLKSITVVPPPPPPPPPPKPKPQTPVKDQTATVNGLMALSVLLLVLLVVVAMYAVTRSRKPKQPEGQPPGPLVAEHYKQSPPPEAAPATPAEAPQAPPEAQAPPPYEQMPAPAPSNAQAPLASEATQPVPAQEPAPAAPPAPPAAPAGPGKTENIDDLLKTLSK